MDMNYQLTEVCDKVGDVEHFCRITYKGQVFTGSGSESGAIAEAEEKLNDFIYDTQSAPEVANWENSIESFLCRD